MPVPVVQIPNSRSRIAFPFDDDADVPDIVSSAVVDACVCVQSADQTPVVMSSFHVGPSIVSVSFSVDGVGGLSAVATSDAMRQFEPVPMRSTSPFLSGTVTFGDVQFGNPSSFRDPIRLSESAVLRPVPGRLDEFTEERLVHGISGDIGIVVPDSVSMEFTDDTDGNVSTIRFSCSDELSDEVEAGCDTGGTNGRSRLPRIKTINGVAPDSKGRIAIVFAPMDWSGR